LDYLNFGRTVLIFCTQINTEMRMLRYHLAAACKKAFAAAVEPAVNVKASDLGPGGAYHGSATAARQDRGAMLAIIARAVTGRLPTASDEAFAYMAIESLVRGANESMDAEKMAVYVDQARTMRMADAAQLLAAGNDGAAAVHRHPAASLSRQPLLSLDEMLAKVFNYSAQ
jgi:hypothetical protein